MGFHIAFVFSWIRLIILRYDVVKDNFLKEMLILCSILAITHWNNPYKCISHIGLKSVHSPVKCHRFHPSVPNSFPVPASILKNAQKRLFSGGRVNTFEPGARLTENDSLQSRPICSLSSGVYGMSLRLSVAEQSAQDRSDVSAFFDPANFLAPNG